MHRVGGRPSIIENTRNIVCCGIQKDRANVVFEGENASTVTRTVRFDDASVNAGPAGRTVERVRVAPPDNAGRAGTIGTGDHKTLVRIFHAIRCLVARIRSQILDGWDGGYRRSCRRHDQTAKGLADTHGTIRAQMIGITDTIIKFSILIVAVAEFVVRRESGGKIEDVSRDFLALEWIRDFGVTRVVVAAR